MQPKLSEPKESHRIAPLRPTRSGRWVLLSSVLFERLPKSKVSVLPLQPTLVALPTLSYPVSNAMSFTSSCSHRIERVKVKGKGARQPSLPTLEPNFYLYEPLPANEEEFARMTERRRQQQQQEQQQQRQQRMGVARLRSDPSSEHKSSHERLCSLISQNPSSDQVAREPREDATWRSAPNPGTTPLSSADAETLAILRRLEALRASQQAGGAAYAYPSQASLLSPTSPLLREAASLRPLPLNPAVQNSLTSHLLLLQAQQDEQIRQLAFLSHATAANAASANAAVSTLAASAAARGYAPNNAAPSLQPNETSLTLQLLERLRNLQQRDNQR